MYHNRSPLDNPPPFLSSPSRRGKGEWQLGVRKRERAGAGEAERALSIPMKLPSLATSPRPPKIVRLTSAPTIGASLATPASCGLGPAASCSAAVDAILRVWFVAARERERGELSLASGRAAARLSQKERSSIGPVLQAARSALHLSLLATQA